MTFAGDVDPGWELELADCPLVVGALVELGSDGGTRRM